jgi:hypothetical protein
LLLLLGFGLLGHAQAMARNQKNEVSFVIHNLPVIAKMSAVAKACGNMFQLLQVSLIFDLETLQSMIFTELRIIF